MAEYLSSALLIAKGAFIGATMSVPGVSGGSMAMMLGIYDRLITSVSRVFSEPKKSIPYLLKLCIGAGAGLALFARLMDFILKTYPVPASFFFLGAVIGGIPVILKSAEVQRFDYRVFLFPVIGILSVYGISLLPTGLFAVREDWSVGYVLLQLLGGLIIAVALVLPGISTSHMLLMLGLYQTVIQSAKNLDVLSLLPLLLGILIGTFLTGKALDKLFERYRLQTYLAAFGFLLGSLAELFPGMPKSGELLPAVLCLVIGAVSLYAVSRLGAGS